MELPRASQLIVEAAAAQDLAIEIHTFPDGTKTASDAARAVGCDVAAIVKSLVFLVDGAPVLALVPGDKRLDTKKLAAAAGGAKCGRADLETVRSATGFVAGGTPPFAHATELPIFADHSLTRHDEVWAAGGTPSTVFPLSVDDLLRLSGAVWADLAE